MEEHHKHPVNRILVVALVIVVLLLVVLAYFLYTTRTELASTRGTLAEELRKANERITELTTSLSTTSEELAMTIQDKEQLEEELEDEKERNEDFEDQIKKISGTVGQLDKLSQLDPELLQKYSRVYFLNENYMPEKLRQLNQKYVYSSDEPEFLEREVVPFFEEMVEDAKDEDIDLFVVSGFRSFDEQEALKGQYLTTYGSGSNAFSADQGYSEHQLGTTVDLTTTGLNGNIDGFQNTEAYEWLVDNAYKYGFVLSYPENNSYYVFEPWHWRFVGEELARDLHRDDKHFYDLEQRDLDKYLINIFD